MCVTPLSDTGQITVRAPNKTAHGEGNDTCSGEGTSYFACYSGWQDASGPHAPPGYRLSFPTSSDPTKPPGSFAEMQSCGLPPIDNRTTTWCVKNNVYY